jgi:hypothetical protein
MPMIFSLPRITPETAACTGVVAGAAAGPAFKSFLGIPRPEPAQLDPAACAMKPGDSLKVMLRPETPATTAGCAPTIPRLPDLPGIAKTPPVAPAAALEVVAVERAMDAARSFGPVQCIRLEVGGGTVTVRAGACQTGMAVEVTTDSRVSPETRRAIVEAVRRRAPGAAISERRRSAR